MAGVLKRGEQGTLKPISSTNPVATGAVSSRMYFGWWIVFSASALTALAAGVYFFGFSAFFLPVASEFNVSRGMLSLVVSLASLEGGILGPVQGYFIDKYGPRRLMYIGVALMGLGFILLSTASSIGPFVVYFVVFIAIGAGMGMFAPSFAAVANWFVRRRGTAFGITMSGFGLGATLVAGTNFLVENLGWRGAAVTIGLLVWLVGFPLASIMRHKPEKYGLLPDGAHSPPPAVDPKHPYAGQEIDFTLREALSSASFWFLNVGFALRALVGSALGLHFIPAMVDKGYSAATGAALLGLFGVLSLPGRLGFGILGDRYDKRLVAGSLGGVMGLAMLSFAWSRSLWQVLVFLVLYALSSGGGASLMFALRGEYFGRKAFATLSGLGSTVMVAGTIAGPFIAGITFDHTGSYNVAFYIFAIFSVGSMIALLLAKRPVPKGVPPRS